MPKRPASLFCVLLVGLLGCAPHAGNTMISSEKSDGFHGFIDGTGTALVIPRGPDQDVHEAIALHVEDGYLPARSLGEFIDGTAAASTGSGTSALTEAEVAGRQEALGALLYYPLAWGANEVLIMLGLVAVAGTAVVVSNGDHTIELTMDESTMALLDWTGLSYRQEDAPLLTTMQQEAAGGAECAYLTVDGQCFDSYGEACGSLGCAGGCRTFSAATRGGAEATGVACADHVL